MEMFATWSNLSKYLAEEFVQQKNIDADLRNHLRNSIHLSNQKMGFPLLHLFRRWFSPTCWENRLKRDFSMLKPLQAQVKHFRSLCRCWCFLTNSTWRTISFRTRRVIESTYHMPLSWLINIPCYDKFRRISLQLPPLSYLRRVSVCSISIKETRLRKLKVMFFVRCLKR